MATTTTEIEGLIVDFAKCLEPDCVTPVDLRLYGMPIQYTPNEYHRNPHPQGEKRGSPAGIESRRTFRALFLVTSRGVEEGANTFGEIYALVDGRFVETISRV